MVPTGRDGVRRPSFSELFEYARLANAPLEKLPPKTVGTFKIGASTVDIIMLHENGIHNAISVDQLTLTPHQSTIDEIDSPTEPPDTTLAQNAKRNDETAPCTSRIRSQPYSSTCKDRG